jgi:hypothetical protein
MLALSWIATVGSILDSNMSQLIVSPGTVDASMSKPKRRQIQAVCPWRCVDRPQETQDRQDLLIFIRNQPRILPILIQMPRIGLRS